MFALWYHRRVENWTFHVVQVTIRWIPSAIQTPIPRRITVIVRWTESDKKSQRIDSSVHMLRTWGQQLQKLRAHSSGTLITISNCRHCRLSSRSRVYLIFHSHLVVPHTVYTQEFSWCSYYSIWPMAEIVFTYLSPQSLLSRFIYLLLWLWIVQMSCQPAVRVRVLSLKLKL